MPPNDVGMDAASLYTKGAKVWIEDEEEGWVVAVVDSVDGDKYTVKPEGKSDALVLKSKPPMCNQPEQWELSDMINLNYIHEPGILQTLEKRFEFDAIYTYSGIVLISVNPFKRISGLYDEDMIQAYTGQQMGQGLDPHLYAVAEEAFQCLCREKQSQSIIVSGESGAGKTVSAKFVMTYLANVCGSVQKEGESSVEDQIMASNPILEAIGNAKTTRNDNSSRFGKFMQLQMSAKQEITGALIRVYLLEKSRVVSHSPQERNYHIFYQMIAGLSDEDKDEWKLSGCEDFRYTNQGVPSVHEMDDKDEFRQVVEAMATIGIDNVTTKQIWRCLAGILHLGNIVCVERGIKEIEENAIICAEIFGIKIKDLVKWINKRKIVAGKDTMMKPNTKSEQYDAIDALSKAIYAHTFEWLVEKINKSVSGSDTSSFIGILDIYGFESFDKNSFEQFCINYANENLQQQFNSHVFRKEQEDYVKEEIEWSFIGFSDNKPCLELIEAKIGILSLLDEECVMTKGSDENFCEKVSTNFKDHEYFAKPRMQGKRSLFIVKHYAHPVTYDCEGFLEKNRDKISPELIDVMRQSSIKYLAELFPVIEEVKDDAPKRGKKVATVGSQFKTSLKLLMETIYTTNTHYVRCLKPNLAKKAGLFTRAHILEQLRACGVLSTIKISQAGYPGKVPYEQFGDRYRLLAKGVHNDLHEMCKSVIISQLKEGNFQFGKTKIFLRSGQQALLEAKRLKVLSDAVIVMQSFSRMVICRSRFNVRRKAAIKVQSFIRCMICTRIVQEMRELKAILILQKRVRGFCCRTNYVKLISAIKIQKMVRGKLARLRFAAMKAANNAAIFIQTRRRMVLCRRDYLTIVAKVIYIQSHVKRTIARKQFKKMRAEARDVKNQMSKAMEKTNIMEKKVLELSSQKEQLKTAMKEMEKSYEEKLSKLQRQNEHGNNNTAELQEKVLLLSKQLEDKDKKIEDLEKKCNDSEATVRDLQDNLASAHLELQPAGDSSGTRSRKASVVRTSSTNNRRQSIVVTRTMSVSSDDDMPAPAARVAVLAEVAATDDGIKRETKMDKKKAAKKLGIQRSASLKSKSRPTSIGVDNDAKGHERKKSDPFMATNSFTIDEADNEKQDKTEKLKASNTKLKAQNKKMEKQISNLKQELSILGAAAAATVFTEGAEDQTPEEAIKQYQQANAKLKAANMRLSNEISNMHEQQKVNGGSNANSDVTCTPGLAGVDVIHSDLYQKIQNKNKDLINELEILKHEVSILNAAGDVGVEGDENLSSEQIQQNLQGKNAKLKAANMRLSNEITQLKESGVSSSKEEIEELREENENLRKEIDVLQQKFAEIAEEIKAEAMEGEFSEDDGEDYSDDYTDDSGSDEELEAVDDNPFHMCEFEEKDIPKILNILTSTLNTKNTNGQPIVAYVMSRCLRYTIYFNMQKERHTLSTHFIKKVNDALGVCGPDLNIPLFWLFNFFYLGSSLYHEQSTVRQVTTNFISATAGIILISFRKTIDIIEQRIKPLIFIVADYQKQSQKGFFSRLVDRTMNEFISMMDTILTDFRANSIPFFLIEAVFQHISTFIGVSVLQRLILRKEYCTWNKSMCISENVELIINWYNSHKFHQDSYSGLEPLLQALNLLKVAIKLPKAIPNISCLAQQQVKKILSNYHGDYGEKISGQTLNTVLKSISANQRGPTLVSCKEITPPDVDLSRFVLPSLSIPAALDFLNEMQL